MVSMESHTGSTTLSPKEPVPLPRIYAWFSAVTENDIPLLTDLNMQGIPTDIFHPLRHTTALMEATRLGRTAMVEWLLAHGAAPALLCGLPKGSALHCAIRRRHWKIVDALLSHMNQTSVVDAYGATPLHALCLQPQMDKDLDKVIEIALLVLDKGCPLDALDHEGVTALHHCVVNDACELAEILLTHGANPNALIPDSGVSPLMIAALEKNTYMANLLIRYGANTDQRTRTGASPASVYPALAQSTPHT
jgi:ankyrin repeat protein